MKILVAYDGTIDSKTALKYGIDKVREKGGELLLLSVFNSNLFIHYDGGLGAQDAARRELAGFVEEARALLSETASDIKSRLILEEGNPEKEIVRYAKAEEADVILLTPRYKAVLKNAPCPVSIIPGNLLVPQDNSELPAITLEKIIKEAKATASKVVLLGVVPIHIYSSSEKHVMEKVKKETSAVMKKTKKALDEQGIDVKEIMRSGYPDEEILKVADEFSVSMIIITADRNTPSELNKAASIILEETDSLTRPVLFVPESNAL